MGSALRNYNTFWDYIEANEAPAMSDKTCPCGFFSIIALMAEDCDYEIERLYGDDKRLFVRGYADERENELMLRYDYGPDSSLVVARVSFIHKRKGNMTRLYQLLKKLQKKYNTGPIIIESALSEGMKAWCIKNGFKEMENKAHCYIEPMNG